MEKQKSLAKIEQDIRHLYRNNLNHAESDEDVRKFFVYAIRDLVEQACEGRVIVGHDDIRLDHKADDFVLSNTLKKDTIFMGVWNTSDLSAIVKRLAESAFNHIKHLNEKHPDKTESKIYPTPSHAGQRFINRPTKR